MIFIHARRCNPQAEFFRENPLAMPEGAPWLDDKQKRHLKLANGGNQSATRKRLLARAMAQAALPQGVQARFYPSMRANISLAYSRNYIFWARSENRAIGIDAEALFAQPQAKAVAWFLQKATGKRFQNHQPCELARIWTVCEALLKLARAGWRAAAGKILAGADIQAPAGRFQSGGWRSLAFCGHYIAIAWQGERQPEFVFDLAPFTG